jgi:phosphopantothenoylcysteine synthetase/decarboxylase
LARSTKLRVLVTGGPTRAYLDRVRFLTNISSGELAFILCRELSRRGIEVALISGPTAQPFEKLKLAHWSSVETADEMHAEVMRLCRTFRPQFAVFTAAVLDFAPVKKLAGKVSSAKKRWNITLRPTPKIIDDVGRRFPGVIRIGFKLEWKRGTAKAMHRFAMRNIEKKGLDALCLNFLSEIGGGRHPAQLITRDGKVHLAKTKAGIARWIARYVRTAR